ncbi:MAG: NAD-dependent epimerase/dehydratase family protein [bacterium]
MVNNDMPLREIRSCFVTGGTGFIGSHLVEFLLSRDTQVRCLVRDTGRSGWLKGLPVDLVKGDLGSRNALEEGAAGVDAVFHLAGAVAAVNRDEYFNVNAKGCRNLAEATLRANRSVKTFIYVSSIAAAGPSRPGSAVSEDGEPHPVSHYGRSKLEGERLLASFEGLPLVIVRPSGVYGPRDSMGLTFFKIGMRGLLPLFNAAADISLINVHDLVRGIVLAARKRRIGAIYNLADETTVKAAELPDIIGRALGVKVRSVPLPACFLWAAALPMEVKGRLTGRMPNLNLQKVRELTASGWVCSTQKAAQELAFRTEVKIEDGFEEVARWYREHGWL